MIINHNLSAINSHRVLKFQHDELSKNMEKLSSGMRINRGGDDASGLAVSEKMRTQVAGLRQAERNTEDGMSLIQTSEGYLNELSELLQRIRVLGVQSSNGIYTAEDRQMMQVEVSQLIDEVDRIASQAEFNTMKLLQGDFAPSLNLRTQAGGIESISTASKANSMIGLMDNALQMVNRQRANLGAYYNRLEYAAKGLMNAYENIQASESRIRDTDMAEEMTKFTKNQILTQSGTAMLAQANAKPQSVLQLLR